MNNRNSQLVFDSKVIHTKFQGEIDCDEILSAIEDWKVLIKNNDAIQVLIFDYMNATMAPLSSLDVIKIAEKTAVLTGISNNLIMIGVMSQDLDVGLTNMWRAYSNLSSSIPDDQMYITRNLEDAFSLIEKLPLCNA